jgi:uncharacterized protein (TIGR00269 family)
MRRKIEEHRMLEGAGRVAVALSGGKDSVALLLSLQRLGWVMGFEVVALHFHLGMGDFSRRNLEMVEELAGRCGLPLRVVRLSDLGVRVARVKGWNPCAVCGVIKRSLFNREAREAGAQVVATAHTLEDILLFSLKNILSRRYAFPRPVLPEQAGMVRKVKPLMFTPERLNAIYCRLRGAPFFEEKCPFWEPHPHRLKEVFDHLEEVVPSGKLQLLLSLQQAFPSGEDELRWEEMRPCEACGEPSSQQLCGLCRLRDWFSSHPL